MSDAKDSAATTTTKSGGRSLLRSWKMLAVLLVVITATAGAAAYWYLAPLQTTQLAKSHPAAPPIYLEVKPFVVSISTDYGTTHFVELGFNLALPGNDAANAVTAILPEVQDAMRQTILAFKMEDVVTPAGVDKLREAMIARANRLLLQRLGADEVRRLTGGNPNVRLVQNLFFSTLIIE